MKNNKHIEPAQGNESTSVSAPDPVLLQKVRIIFLIVPLYAAMVGFITISLMLGNAESLESTASLLKHPVYWKYVFIASALFFVGLAGVAIRSIECALALKSNPFKAFAIGRYILFLYLLISFPVFVLSAWPIELTLFSFLAFVSKIACEFAKTYALVVFSYSAYHFLKGDRPEYDVDNFVFDITFGWKGVGYLAQRQSEQIPVSTKRFGQTDGGSNAFSIECPSCKRRIVIANSNQEVVVQCMHCKSRVKCAT